MEYTDKEFCLDLLNTQSHPMWVRGLKLGIDTQ